MTFDRERATAWLQRERELADRRRKRAPAAQPLGHALGDLDRRLLDALAAHQGPGGIYPTVGRLADVVGCSRRHARRRLAVLESEGLVERVAVHERPDDPEWARRGRRGQGRGRRTSNSYGLAGGPLGHAPAAAPVDVLGPRTSTNRESAAQPLGHAPGDVLARSVSEATTVSRDTIGAASLEPIEFAVEPPAALQRGRDPSQAEIMATLEQGFGSAEVEQVYPNQLARTPAAFHQAADRLGRATCWSETDRCQPGYRCRRHTRRKPS